MLGPATLIFSLSVFFIFSGVIAANKDDQCLSACSDWSVVVGYCRGQYIESSERESQNMRQGWAALLNVADRSAQRRSNSI